LDLFKLVKLKISGFKDAKRKPPADKEFEAMFNPSTYTRTYSIVWAEKQGLNASAPELKYSFSGPSELSLNLVLDGTGVEAIGAALARKSVSERVKQFLDVTFEYQGVLHEPAYLLVEWGDLSFSCRLSTVEIKYTAFDRDGTPLRAELAVKLITDEEAKQRAKKEEKSSPDLTHARVVRSGDTLPLLTKEIYGSSASYLEVARFNGLDDFRSLTPGRQLLFPPLASLGGGGASKRE
jgi:hypothetical protein